MTWINRGGSSGGLVEGLTRLIDAVEHLMATPNARHAQIWRATLTPEQNALLRVPSVHRDLSGFASRRWVEHVVIGDPFGVLGMDAAGAVSWLQLETPDGLKALAELAELEGVAPEGLQDIRQGRRLPGLELRQALALEGAGELVAAFPVGQAGSLLGAAFEIAPAHSPATANSYAQWLSRQEERQVQD